MYLWQYCQNSIYDSPFQFFGFVYLTNRQLTSCNDRLTLARFARWKFNLIHNSNESFLQIKVHCRCWSTRNGFSTTSIIRISINWDFTATQNYQDAKFNSFLSGIQNLLLLGVGGEKIFVKLTAEEALKKKWASPSSQLTRDHLSRDDDHPLVFKLGSETVVKSSCFTIIDYLPKRSRKTYISIAQKASGKPKDFSHSCVSPSNSMFTNQNQSSNPLAH